MRETWDEGMAKLEAAKEPEALRQLEQWQRWPRGRVKSEESVMRTRMLPHRHVPVIPEAKSEGLCSLGSPVRGFGVVCGCWALMVAASLRLFFLFSFAPFLLSFFLLEIERENSRV